MKNEEVRDCWEDLSELKVDQILPRGSGITCTGKFKFELNGIRSAKQQRSKVGELITMIGDHNSFTNWDNKYIPIMNIGKDKNKFKCTVIGFNGTHHPATVMFDSGCVADGVIGPNMVNKCGITKDKYGVSFVYVIEVDGREFIGYSLSRTDLKSSTSYTEDRRGSGYVSMVDGNPIDILVGYRAMSEMASSGLFVTSNCDVQITKLFKSVPFSSKSGLQLHIGNCSLRAQIDSGCFIDKDLTLSKTFVLNHKGLLKIEYPEQTKTSNKYVVPNYYLGTVPKLTLQYSDIKIELENLTFAAFTNDSDEQGNMMDCIPGTRFMNLLLEKGIVVKLF